MRRPGSGGAAGEAPRPSLSGLAILLVLAACSEPTPRTTETVREPDMPQASRPARTAGPVGDVCVLRARSQQDVVAKFQSTVAELHVKLNDSVAKDQPVARLDDRQLRDALALAKAALVTRRADVSRAGAEYRAARGRRDREKEAFSKGISAKAILDEAQGAFESAGAAVQAAQALLAEQSKKIAIAERQLKETTLTAPEAGRVALIYRQPGEPVTEGSAIVRLISNDELIVLLATESKLALKEDQAIELTLDDKQLRVKATVKRVAPSTHAIAGVVVSEAELVDPPAGLQSGMSCRFSPAK